MRDLVHLDPEETKEFIFILRPRISSPCRLRVEFYNDRSTVSIMEDVSMKAREGVNVARPVEKDVEEPDLWRGHVIIEIPMTVAKRAARGRYSVEAFPRLGVLQQHEFLETLHPTQNEGDCEVIAEAIRMLPRENPLRFRCWSSLAPALAKGVGAALVPFAVDELENKENTQPLRILLVQLVAELRSKPALECDEDHNLICIKLTEEVRARIDRVLEVVSADPVLAEAAKVDPPEDDR